MLAKYIGCVFSSLLLTLYGLKSSKIKMLTKSQTKGSTISNRITCRHCISCGKGWSQQAYLHPLEPPGSILANN